VARAKKLIDARSDLTQTQKRPTGWDRQRSQLTTAMMHYYCRSSQANVDRIQFHVNCICRFVEPPRLLLVKFKR
jgi:hypothetical protein